MKNFLWLLYLVPTLLLPIKGQAVELLIVANVRHLSFVVPMQAVPDSLLPKDIPYRNYQSLDISIGQDPYFYVKSPSLFLSLQALVLSSPSVVRLHPFSGNPKQNFKGKSILSLEISQAQLDSLLAFV